jgi:hypothetical protein
MILRVYNIDGRQNPIGPFGGSAAFTDNMTKAPAARAMLHRRMLEKRMAAKFPEFRYI